MALLRALDFDHMVGLDLPPPDRMPEHKRVRIVAGMEGRYSMVFIDDIAIRGVKRVNVDMDAADRMPRATIELIDFDLGTSRKTVR